ncbi:DUF4174 domain-containing protein [Salinisphaera aquimarina]|uniref:DUF4174 domain-containing protein n=1 Tax=Salinisphaera aquimarina TaxID=2094031 RepID=A0ABV7EMD8_9GAMM
MPSFLRWSLFAALTCAAGSADAATLHDLQGRYRVIVVFAPAETVAADAAATLKRAADGIDDRDIAWFVVGPGALQSNIDTPLDRDALETLHQTDGFETVLVGKDGGVKSRQTETLDVNTLFADIDQMPMRRREMENR